MWLFCWSSLQTPYFFQFTAGNFTCYNFHPHPFPCLQTYCLSFFYWNSLIQRDVWFMTSSEWELYVGATLLTNFKDLKRVGNFLLILDKNKLTYKISKEIRIAIASVVGLNKLSSNLRIIILRSITWLIIK